MDFESAIHSFSSSEGGGIRNGAFSGPSNGLTIFSEIDKSFEKAQKTNTVPFEFMHKFFAAFQGMASSVSIASITNNLAPPPGMVTGKMPGIINQRGGGQR